MSKSPRPEDNRTAPLGVRPGVLRAGLILSFAAALAVSVPVGFNADTSTVSPALDPACMGRDAIFQPFLHALTVRCDSEFMYVESNSWPDHETMVGITAWNEQVPVPQGITGGNSWRIPMSAVPAAMAEPTPGQGPLGVAANGVMIYNPTQQDGVYAPDRDPFLIGELDACGGHSGRGDDYHYHTAPTCVIEEMGADPSTATLPVGYIIDGYPLYGPFEPGGGVPAGLDACGGHDHDDLGYHYHSQAEAPYVNGCFSGVVDLDLQPAPTPPSRPAGQPRQTLITAHYQDSSGWWRLEYDNGPVTGAINYTADANGCYVYEFVDDVADSGDGFMETYCNPGVSLPAGTMSADAVVHSASFAQGPLSPGAAATLFGNAFSWISSQAPAFTAPNSLTEGIQMTVTDAAGRSATAPLLYGSPRQINFLVPEGLAAGDATVTVRRRDGTTVAASTTLASAAPGLYSMNSNGAGVGAMTALLVANGANSGVDVFEYSESDRAFVATPLDVTAGELYLSLYGTGFRNASSVTATVGGTSVPVLAFAAQSEFPGLDQANIGPLPASLQGAGEVPVVLTADGVDSNPVTAAFAGEPPAPDAGTVTTGSAPVDTRQSFGPTTCGGGAGVNFVPATWGRVTAEDGTQWNVPATPTEEPIATDIYNPCTGGANAGYESQLETVVVDEGGSEITATVFADNYFELYVNGRMVGRDSIAFVPFNSSAVRFQAQYPITYAVKLVDWDTHNGLGLEYDRYQVGDGGFIASFSDGTITNSEWKCQPVSTAPLDSPSCVQAETRDSTGCSAVPACASADPESCRGLQFSIPEDWAQPEFDDSSWSHAATYESQQVTNQPAYVNYAGLFGQARFIWSRNLDLDNQVLCRITVVGPR